MPATGQVPDSDAADEPRLIGERYRLTDPLGRGAMGTVWAGYDEVLHRPVAVKELRVPPGIPSGEMDAMRERMMREARTLGGLSHPNVITLYDVVDVAGDPYVVLELLPSRNLGEVIDEQGRLSVGQAAAVGLAVAAALQASHRANITHRDVKPGNVLVAHDGRIKLTDYGIARRRDDLTMTATGLVLGSPAYIAPEVAAGEEVTPAADLWGLGATLFAAMEGRPPYDVDGDPVKTVTAVVHGEVPRPTSAGPITELITALMVKDPGRRIPLAEVRRRLRPMLTDPDDPLFPGAPEAFSPPPAYDPGSPSIGAPAVTEQPSGPLGPGGARPDASGSLPHGFGPSPDPAPPRPSGPAPRAGSAPHSGPVQGPAPGPAPGPAQQSWPPRRFGETAARSGHLDSGHLEAGSSHPPAPLAADPGPLPAGPSWPSPVSRTGAGWPAGPGGAPAQPSAGHPQTRSGSYPGGPPPRPPAPAISAPTDRVRRPQPAEGGSALPLLAGALAVVIGVAGGWAGTRVLVRQSPLTTTTVSPGALSPANALKTHDDTPRTYGPGALGFTVGVPRDWEEYRLAGDNDVVTVLFVSPDGSRELRFDRLRGSANRQAQPADFVNGLTAARLGVATVNIQERTGNQVRYRTDRTTAQGTSSRISYAQLTPAGTDLWVIQLVVPADAAGDTNEQLFGSIVAGFRP